MPNILQDRKERGRPKTIFEEISAVIPIVPDQTMRSKYPTEIKSDKKAENKEDYIYMDQDTKFIPMITEDTLKVQTPSMLSSKSLIQKQKIIIDTGARNLRVFNSKKEKYFHPNKKLK